MNEERKKVKKIIFTLRNDPRLKPFEKKGLCRIWSFRAAKLVKEDLDKEENVRVSIREIRPELGLTHSFLELRSRENPEEVVYCCDGVGFGENDPYWGRSDGAPHLSRSTSDILNFYLDDIKEVSR